MTAKISDPSTALAFALAGRATLTLRSERTGTRYTFKITKPREKAAPSLFFVSVMFGPDNEGDFRYIGQVYASDLRFVIGRKVKLPATDPRTAAFAYFWKHIAASRIAPSLEIWHEGRCGRCARKLTVPESIERGIGPECAGKVGGSMRFMAEEVARNEKRADAAEIQRREREEEIARDRRKSDREALAETSRVAEERNAEFKRQRVADYARAAARRNEEARRAPPATIYAQSPLYPSESLETIRTEARAHGIAGTGLTRRSIFAGAGR